MSPYLNPLLLVVEDAKDIQFLLKLALEANGYRIHISQNGAEAIDFLTHAAELPRLILLDLMMPVMDGFEFRRQQLASSRLAGIPVIVMTADAKFNPSDSAMRANAVLRKPADLGLILSTVQRFSQAPLIGPHADKL